MYSFICNSAHNGLKQPQQHLDNTDLSDGQQSKLYLAVQRRKHYFLSTNILLGCGQP